jgi:NADPH:quinone reductase-like Zn-dependent oxidoreductase
MYSTLLKQGITMKRILSISSLLIASALLSACSSDDELATTSASESLTIPTTQMAIVQTGNGGPEVLQYQSIPVMEPGANQVLIKVVAAAINPIERRSREGGGRPPVPAGPAPDAAAGGAPPAGGRPGGDRPGPGGASGPSVPGGDISGIVVKLGEGVSNVAVGDAVFAKLAFGQTGLNGAYSEYAVAPANQTNPKPTDQTFAEAAGLSTVGGTALRTIKHAEVAKGQRVFINGIGGGIGSSAAQFAVARGAYVLGTASGRHHEYLASIGVNEAINYREVQFDEVITEPVDVVIETVSTATANQALNILKPGGKLVSISGAADPALCEAKEVDCSRIGGEFGWSNEVILKEVYEIAQAGNYRLNVDGTFPLEEAGAAQEQNFNVGTTGKIVLIVNESMANTK